MSDQPQKWRHADVVELQDKYEGLVADLRSKLAACEKELAEEHVARLHNGDTAKRHSDKCFELTDALAACEKEREELDAECVKLRGQLDKAVYILNDAIANWDGHIDVAHAAVLVSEYEREELQKP